MVHSPSFQLMRALCNEHSTVTFASVVIMRSSRFALYPARAPILKFKKTSNVRNKIPSRMDQPQGKAWG